MKAYARRDDLKMKTYARRDWYRAWSISRGLRSTLGRTPSGREMRDQIEAMDLKRNPGYVALLATLRVMVQLRPKESIPQCP